MIATKTKVKQSFRTSESVRLDQERRYRRETEATLREVAFVLKLTERVKAALGKPAASACS